MPHTSVWSVRGNLYRRHVLLFPCGSVLPHIQPDPNPSWLARWSSSKYFSRFKNFLVIMVHHGPHSAHPWHKLVGAIVPLQIFFKVWKLSLYHPVELSGPGEPNRQGSVQRQEFESFAETSEDLDDQLLGNIEENVANNNNDQTSDVNTVNNMNTAVQSNNNNVNVLDVILVGSPRVSHPPIGWNTNWIHMSLPFPAINACRNRRYILLLQ